MLAYALTRDTTLASPLIGRPAPSFDVRLFDPEPGAEPWLSLADLSGKPVVLNFWASWCVSCRAEARVLEAGWKRHGPAVVFLGIAVNDEAEAARAFIERYGKTYLLAQDVDGRAAVDYGLYGVPETFFIDPAGRVLARHVGPLTTAELDRRIADLTSGVVGSATGDRGTVTPLSPRR